MADRTAVIAGASGLIGSFLLNRLLAERSYGRVVSLGRNELPVQDPKLEQHRVDFRTFEDTALFRGVDDIFCTLGTTIAKAGSQEAFREVDVEYPLKLASLGKKGGASRFLIVSSMGADPHARIFYSRMKGTVERELQNLGLPSLAIFRPSMLLGPRKEFRPGEALAAPILRLLSFAMVGSLRKYRPIHADTVARAMVAVALHDHRGTVVFESDQIQQIAEQP